jgi:hypothetical protein
MCLESWEGVIVASLRLAVSSRRQWTVDPCRDHPSVEPGDRVTARVAHSLDRAIIGHALACRAAGRDPLETLLVVRALCRPWILPVLATDQGLIGRALLARIVTCTMLALFPCEERRR